MANKFIYTTSKDSDYLQHWGKGGEAKQHLYTARKWVNGKWQYVYGKVNNALGADEREARDSSKKTWEQAASNYEVADKKANYYNNLANSSKENKQKYGDFERNTNREKNIAAAKQRVASDQYRKAQKAYDKTFYGKVDQAKAAGNYVKGVISDKIKAGKEKVKDMFEAIKRKRRDNVDMNKVRKSLHDQGLDRYK